MKMQKGSLVQHLKKKKDNKEASTIWESDFMSDISHG